MSGADQLAVWRASQAPTEPRRPPAAWLVVVLAVATVGAVVVVTSHRSVPSAAPAPPTSLPPDAFAYAGGVLATPAGRFALGKAGDQVAVADWGCEGGATAALLRPSTGQVYRFEGWARPGADAPATVIGRVAGGRSIRAADVDGDGCAEVVVDGATGPVVVP